jgi:hypothetical protein
MKAALMYRPPRNHLAQVVVDNSDVLCLAVAPTLSECYRGRL